jgi:DnaA-homolog protein
MEQLTFELAPPESPSFANFLPGRNVEPVTTLSRLALGQVPETGVVIWGGRGLGKTHLLRATLTAAAARRPTVFYSIPDEVPSDPPAAGAMVAVDQIDLAAQAAQGRLFTLYNALRATGGHLVAAAADPPARMPLRDDLRSRLGWGLIFEILPLADEDKPAALATYARARGFRLSDDVINYLLAHGRRDMATLLATLAAMDRVSLASKRPITVPLLKAWLQRGLPLDPSSVAEPGP